jgi:hypothetical protein
MGFPTPPEPGLNEHDTSGAATILRRPTENCVGKGTSDKLRRPRRGEEYSESNKLLAFHNLSRDEEGYWNTNLLFGGRTGRRTMDFHGSNMVGNFHTINSQRAELHTALISGHTSKSSLRHCGHFSDNVC